MRRCMQTASLLLIAAVLAGLFSAPSRAEQETIRVGFNCNAVPYHFIGEGHANIGLHIDMMDWIAKQKELNILYVPYETNGACLEALKSGAIDVVLGHKTNDTAAAGLQYTDELSSSSLCLVVAADRAEELSRAKNYGRYSAAIEYGSAANAYLTKMGINSYLSEGNQTAVFQTLIDGDVDLALLVYDSFSYQAREMGLSDEFTVLRSYVAPVSYAMLVRQDSRELFTTLDAALTEMRASGYYEGIYDKWIVQATGAVDAKVIKRIWTIAFSCIAAVALIAAGIFIMNRILKRRVTEKTKELSDANAELDRRMIQLQSESRIRYGMIEYSPSAMVSFDSCYRVTLLNRAAIAMGGIEGNGIGKDVRYLPIFGEIVNSISYDIFSMAFYGANVNHPVVVELENNGRRSAYRYNFYRSRGERGISGVLLTVEDVTSEEQEKQALFEQEKTQSLSRLVAGIAHEVRNPLMAIRTSASLLKTQWDDPEVRDAFIRFVPDEVDRINQLIEGLINYARPVKREREVVHLADLTRECLYLTAIAAKKHDIRCKTSLDEDAAVFANRDRIKQVMINIIINGIESIEKKLAQGAPGPFGLSIAIRREDALVRVVIRDEGTGMQEEEIRRCTEPFFTTKSAGTGLGLALVQQFINENDGTLAIESELEQYTEIQLTFRRYVKNEEPHSDH